MQLEPEEWAGLAGKLWGGAGFLGECKGRDVQRGGQLGEVTYRRSIKLQVMQKSREVDRKRFGEKEASEGAPNLWLTGHMLTCRWQGRGLKGIL